MLYALSHNAAELKESTQDSTSKAKPKRKRFIPRGTIVRENKIDLDRKRRMERRKEFEPWGAVNSVRLRNVQCLLRDRYGDQLPDDDAGRDDLWTLLNVKSLAVSIPRRKQALLIEIYDWAPWLAEDEAEQRAEQIATYPITFKSDTLGRKLNLTSADRDRLCLWQIRAIDLDANQLEERELKKDRERKRKHRRAKGVKPRAEYEAASLSRSKPWLAMGVSRRTWERYRAKGKLTQVCPATNNDVRRGCPETSPILVRGQTFVTPDGSVSGRILSSMHGQTCVTQHLDGLADLDTEGEIPSPSVTTTPVDQTDDVVRQPEQDHRLGHHPDGMLRPGINYDRDLLMGWQGYVRPRQHLRPKLPVPTNTQAIAGEPLARGQSSRRHPAWKSSLRARDRQFAVARVLGLQ
jgi:hypothetical protein